MMNAMKLTTKNQKLKTQPAAMTLRLCAFPVFTDGGQERFFSLAISFKRSPIRLSQPWSVGR